MENNSYLIKKGYIKSRRHLISRKKEIKDFVNLESKNKGNYDDNGNL